VSPFPAHLLSIDDLGPAEITDVLRITDSFAEVGRRANPKVPTLRGRTVATLFFEDSTRTRMSFETAAKRMSADVLSFAAGSSSVNKGESLRDTIETVEAIGIDAVIIRHKSSGVPDRVTEWVDHCVVINAGDGWHQHPTQALLDLYTVRQAFGGGDAGLAKFQGLQVVIVGDIRHSRVARSQISAYAAMGAEVTLVAPSTLLPPSLDGWPIVAVTTDLDDVLPKADVVSLLRVQSERGSGEFVPTLREYTAGYGLTSRRAAMLQAGAVILHPGPIVRGVEIASDVAELPASLITDQVSNGVAIRMAVLFLLLGQGPAELLGGSAEGPVGSAAEASAEKTASTGRTAEESTGGADRA
jgi:aspartate carbamoyltransferase catalytic subunit